MPESATHKIDATREAYAELQLAYDCFNAELFDGELPGAMITLQRHGRSMGYYSSDRFVNRDRKIGDEIAMNPVYFATRPIEDTLSTLAHEMCHQWRERTGPEPSRRCYHDKQWAEKMKQIGLYPSSTGRPGGKEVGEKVSHYIVTDGAFIHVCKAFLSKHQGIVWYDRFPTEGGKDYDYAAAATVRVPRKQASTKQGEKGSGEGSAVSGALPCVDDGSTEEPVFSPPPVQAGLDVVAIESAPTRHAQVGAARKTDSSNRLKYSCPGCLVNVWGKPELKIECGSCKKPFAVTGR